MEEEKRDEHKEKHEEKVEETIEKKEEKVEDIIKEDKEEIKEEELKRHEPERKIEHKKIKHEMKHHHSKPNLSTTEKFRENPWVLSTIVLGVVVIIFLLSSFGITGNITGSTISGSKAGQIVSDFASSQGVTMDIIDVKTSGDLYEIVGSINGMESSFYLTKDGKNFISNLIPIGFEEENSNEIPKTDIPVVELFVMTHCPYGAQAEKGLIPVIELLGDAIDAKIRFVHYFMHEPEETETPRQVCIREEQPEKWYDYLKCFLEDGDAERCIVEAGVDKEMADQCVIEGRAEGYYDEDSDLSKEYGVGGSPTLIINGVQSNAGRDAVSYLDGICKAMKNPSELCGTNLSSTSPSPGFGYGEGSDTNAQC